MKKTKVCPHCRVEKDLSEFYLTNRPSGSSYCKKCCIIYGRETYNPDKVRVRRVRNRDKINAKKKERYHRIRKQNMEWLLSYLGSKAIHCDRCKYDTCFETIQFHHLDPSQKEKYNDSLAHWLNHFNLHRFQEKILNVDFLLLCANCHIEFHAGLWKYE